jgi:RNA polymerase sigma factor, sigma-70 family
MPEQHEKFCSLIREYRSGLFRVAVGILRNHTDAEDAVSEMTCKAFANFNKLKSLESFKPWAMKILVNEAYIIAKKRKRVEPLDDTTEECIHTDRLEAYELWNAVQLLDVEFRTPTILFYYEDMSIKEISKILSLPQGTVNSRLYRSREKLKKTLTSNGGCINE